MRVLISPHPYHCRPLSLFDSTHPVGVKWCVIVIMNCIPLMTNVINLPFLCSLATCIASFFSFGLTTARHAESSFPDQGSDLCLVQRQHRFLTSGRPGKSCRASLEKSLPVFKLGCFPVLYNEKDIFSEC